MVSTPSRKSERSVYFFTLMDNQISPNGSDFNPVSNRKPRSFRPVFIGLGVVALIVVFWFVYLVFFSPDARRDFEMRKNYDQAIEGLNEFDKRMRDDIYGGKTPQETLNLFIDALKQKNIDLASRYFAFETGGKDAFNNEKWRLGLQKLSDANGTDDLILNIENAKPLGYSENYSWYRKAFNFEGKNKDGEKIDIVLVFNHFSGVWKIENL